MGPSARFYKLARVVRTVLSVGVTSAENERDFSGVKRTLTAYRLSMKNETFARKMRLSKNADWWSPHGPIKEWR